MLARILAVAAVVTALTLPAAARPPCTGDCDGSLGVTVDEIVVLANIALGNSGMNSCAAGDTNGDGSITVDEIVAAVMDALGGCVLTTPIPIATATPVPALRLDVGSAVGVAGSIVSIDVSLSGGQNMVTAASNDIAYDTARIRVVADGDDIACAINPNIGAGTPPAKTLLVGRLPGPGSTEILRLGLVSFTSFVAIPDGLLFTCEFQIDAGAGPGPVLLDNTPSAVTALGQRLEASGMDGAIIIE